jgi:Uma2 family endonuclease
MSDPAMKLPARMSVAEFVAWNAPEGARWQLVDGAPEAMAPASRTHGAILIEVGALISRHLAERSSSCTVIAEPGIVPKVRANLNFRIPDLAVTCTPYQVEEHALTDPVLIIEILSPNNESETWANVWTYTTIPSVQEIVVISSVFVRADLLRRLPDGSWPEKPEVIEDGELLLKRIDFRAPLRAIYRTTRLAR